MAVPHNRDNSILLVRLWFQVTCALNALNVCCACRRGRYVNALHGASVYWRARVTSTKRRLLRVFPSGQAYSPLRTTSRNRSCWGSCQLGMRQEERKERRVNDAERLKSALSRTWPPGEKNGTALSQNIMYSYMIVCYTIVLYTLGHSGVRFNPGVVKR